jgi:hypothetical protein
VWEIPHVKHNLKKWTLVLAIQIAVIVGSFNLPNRIINGATWYAPVLDFGRIVLLVCTPIVDTVAVTRLLAIGRRKKAYLQQFISTDNLLEYESISPLQFIHLSTQQINAIKLAHLHSVDDLVLDADLTFALLKRSLERVDKHGRS